MAKIKHDPKEYAAMRACVSFLAFFLCAGWGDADQAGRVVIRRSRRKVQSPIFEWQAVEDPAVTGYRLYWGTAPRNYESSVDVGPNTSHTVTNLVHGTVYYFAVTAYSMDRESPFSDEVLCYSIGSEGRWWFFEHVRTPISRDSIIL